MKRVRTRPTPFFTVVIPTYNRAALLGEALNSVFAQTSNDYEIIVVDGGSIDETDTVLSSFGSRIRILKETGGGPGGARNLGVEAASGRFVVFVDSDDVIHQTALALYKKVLTDTAEARILLAAYQDLTDQSALKAFARSVVGSPNCQIFTDYLGAALEGHLSGTHRLVVERKLFLEKGGLSQHLRVCEDQDFGLRLGDAGPCVVVSKPATVGYRKHAGNISSNIRSFYVGARSMIHSERSGRYPGGPDRQSSRRTIISRTARSTSVGCLKDGAILSGCRLYTDTFVWHLRQCRLQYLCLFPSLAVYYALSSWSTRVGSLVHRRERTPKK